MNMGRDRHAPAASRPGRPRSEEKRSAILTAAGELFLEHGVERTSMDAVAQQAGVSKQTVYSHFSAKEDLLTACVSHKLEAYEIRDDGELAALALRPGLTLLCRRYLSLVYDDEVLRMFRVIIGSSASHPELARLFWEAGPLRTIDTFTAFLARHAARGDLRVDDPAAAADMLMGLLNGQRHMTAMLNLSVGLDEAQRHAHADRCVAGFLKLFGEGA